SITLFYYLKNIDISKSYWLAPGSNRFVYKSGSFQSKATIAYNNALEAISYEDNNIRDINAPSMLAILSSAKSVTIKPLVV
ncbi:hypothetical protein Q604_UNBC16728G0001, partial [human gut metagenome]